MSTAYVVGNVTVLNIDKWNEYRSKVGATLVPWQGELIFRGGFDQVLAGQHSHTDNVVIKFPTMDALNSWFNSPAYQALIPIRMQAAKMDLVSYVADK